MNVSDAKMLQDHNLDPYVNTGRMGAITVWVVAAHLAVFLLLPLTVWVVSLMKTEEPPLIVMKVGLVDLPEGDSLNAPEDGIKLPEPPAPEPEPVAPPETKPVKPDPVPPAPEPLPPPPKPKNDPPPAPPAPKETPKPKPKPKKKQPLLSADEIRKKRNKNKRFTEQPKTSVADQKRQQQAAARAAQERKNLLASMVQNTGSGKYGHMDGGLKGILANAEEREYFDKLYEYINARFHQPSNALLQGRKPSVTVEISIGADGALRDWRITKSSNVSAMNEAVEAVRGKIQTMPKPPRAMKVPITFRITDDLN